MGLQLRASCCCLNVVILEPTCNKLQLCNTMSSTIGTYKMQHPQRKARGVAGFLLTWMEGLAVHAAGDGCNYSGLVNPAQICHLSSIFVERASASLGDAANHELTSASPTCSHKHEI